MQKDVPQQRTCMLPKEGSQLTKGDIPADCGDKACITCNATNPDKQMTNPDFDIHTSTILAKFIEMKGDA
eukprot:3353537-Heterocapsa_arctica.AAC.1